MARRLKALDLFCGAGGSAMGCDWMTRKEVSQAIPPAYGEFIGKAARQWIEQEVA